MSADLSYISNLNILPAIPHPAGQSIWIFSAGERYIWDALLTWQKYRMDKTVKTTTLQRLFRILLGAAMIFAAIGHLTFLRAEFQAQVPQWLPFNTDLIVVLSGIVEAALGLAIIFWKKERVRVGIALAIFFILIFPGNIAQYVNGTNAFGLNTDKARLIRLFFQPILILWALWSTGALKALTQKDPKIN